MRKRRLFRALTATAAVLAVLVVGQLPASAHTTVTEHGKDWIATGADHQSVTLCDGEKDGHWVYGEWFFDDGSSAYLYNTNGAAGGCEYRVFAGRVVKQMICEESKPNCWVQDVI